MSKSAPKSRVVALNIHRDSDSRQPDALDRLVERCCCALHLHKHTRIFQQIAKFAIVGGIATLIDWGIYFALTAWAQFEPLVANIFSSTVSIIYSYFANTTWVFDTTAKKSKQRLFGEYVILSVVGVGITEVLLMVFIDGVGLGDMLAKIIATAIVMVFNFITRKLFLEGKV